MHAWHDSLLHMLFHLPALWRACTELGPQLCSISTGSIAIRHGALHASPMLTSMCSGHSYCPVPQPGLLLLLLLLQCESCAAQLMLQHCSSAVYSDLIGSCQRSSSQSFDSAQAIVLQLSGKASQRSHSGICIAGRATVVLHQLENCQAGSVICCLKCAAWQPQTAACKHTSAMTIAERDVLLGPCSCTSQAHAWLGKTKNLTACASITCMH